jgi:hypothetical protein
MAGDITDHGARLGEVRPWMNASARNNNRNAYSRALAGSISSNDVSTASRAASVCRSRSACSVLEAQ